MYICIYCAYMNICTVSTYVNTVVIKTKITSSGKGVKGKCGCCQPLCAAVKVFLVDCRSE